MSKDLEKEYRALMDSEAPDLWARIEAGLEEKPVRLHQTRSTGTRRHLKLWVSLAAACACVALSIPVMTRHLSSGGSTSDTTASDNNAAIMECAPEAAEGAAEAYAGAAASDNAGRSSNEAGSDRVCDGMNPSVQGKADRHLNTDTAQETVVQEGRSFVVTAEILETDIRRSSGIVYVAKVVTTEDAAVQADSEIKIFSSALGEEGVISLEKSQVYELTLIDNETDSEEEPVYILQAVVNP